LTFITVLHDPISGHNHNTKIANISFASEVEGSPMVNALRMANLADTKAGGATEESYAKGKTKERCQGSHAAAHRTSRRRMLSPNIVGL
jgi:hypothetical protein